mgnify:CR=1 FL=1
MRQTAPSQRMADFINRKNQLRPARYLVQPGTGFFAASLLDAEIHQQPTEPGLPVVRQELARLPDQRGSDDCRRNTYFGPYPHRTRQRNLAARHRRGTVPLRRRSGICRRYRVGRCRRRTVCRCRSGVLAERIREQHIMATSIQQNIHTFLDDIRRIIDAARTNAVRSVEFLPGTDVLADGTTHSRRRTAG